MRLVAAIVLSLALLPAVLFGLFACVMTPFLFDAPDTESQAATWIMAGSVFSMPVTTVAALACVWIVLPPRRSKWWYAGLALPALSVLTFWIAGSFRPGFF